MNLLDVLKTVDAKAKMESTPEYKTIDQYSKVRDKYQQMLDTIVAGIANEDIDKKTKTSIKKKSTGMLSTISDGIYDKTSEMERNLFKNFLTPLPDNKSCMSQCNMKNRIGQLPKTDFRFIKTLSEKFKMIAVPLDYVNENFVEKLSKNQKDILVKFLDDCYYMDLAPYILAPIEYYDHWKHLNSNNINQFSYFPECYQDVKMALDIQLLSQKNMLIMSQNNSTNIKMIKSNVELLQSKLNNLETRVVKLEREEIIRKEEEIKKIKLEEVEQLRKAQVNKDPMIFALPADTKLWGQDRKDEIKRNIIVNDSTVTDDSIAVTNICFGDDFDDIFAHYYGLTHYKENRKQIEEKLEKIYLGGK